MCGFGEDRSSSLANRLVLHTWEAGQRHCAPQGSGPGELGSPSVWDPEAATASQLEATEVLGGGDRVKEVPGGGEKVAVQVPRVELESASQIQAP